MDYFSYLYYVMRLRFSSIVTITLKIPIWVRNYRRNRKYTVKKRQSRVWLKETNEKTKYNTYCGWRVKRNSPGFQSGEGRAVLSIRSIMNLTVLWNSREYEGNSSTSLSVGRYHYPVVGLKSVRNERYFFKLVRFQYKTNLVLSYSNL